MPMTQGKMVIFFGATGGQGVPPTGWTETWYKTEVDYKNLLGFATGYAKVRKQLLGINAFITAVRVSDALIKRDTLFEQLNADQGEGKVYNQAGDEHDPTQVDLLIRLESTELRRRSLFMAGLPDSVAQQLKENGIGAAFLNGPSMKAWMRYITDNQFAIRFKDPANPGLFLLGNITGIVPRMVRNRKRGRPFDLFRGRLT